MNEKKRTALVLGAGWAGLACAVNLAERGFAVTVLEQSGRLGGRASSFVDAQTGEVLDNGQHLMMGCYHSTLNFLRKIGAQDSLEFQRRLRVPFFDSQGRRFDLACPSLPAPLHLLLGVLGFSPLSWRDKFNLFKIDRAVKRSFQASERERLKTITVLQWLRECGQSDGAVNALWDPICLATVNLAAARAEADSFVTVLRLAFFAEAQDSCLVVPRAGLSELCGERTQNYLRAREGKILNHQLVARIETQNGQVSGVVTRDGRRWTADVYVSALSFYTFRNVMDAAWMDQPFFSGAKKMKSSPIFSVALWIDRPIIQEQFCGLLNTRVQWVFNKNLIFKKQRSGQYLALVISDAEQFLSLSDAEIFSFAADELRRAFPNAREAKIEKYLIQREKNATLLHTPGYQALRPSQTTALSNFFLCGDWTDTGLPATIESATRSAEMACARIA